MRRRLFHETSASRRRAPWGVRSRGARAPTGRTQLFRFVRAGGCKPYPEAKVGATGPAFRGTNRDGTVFGFSDIHLHVTSDLRAGGQVIYGGSFDRFGITEALGHDDRVHGPDGSLDVTGNLQTNDAAQWPEDSRAAMLRYTWLKGSSPPAQARLIAAAALDSALRVEGFLCAKSARSKKLVLHITNVVFGQGE